MNSNESSDVRKCSRETCRDCRLVFRRFV